MLFYKNRSLIKKSTNWLLIFLAGIVLLLPIIVPMFPRGCPQTWDSEAHLVRMAAFHKSILDGQIPPRWVTTLAFDYGSPVLMFNWSLPYWLAEPFLFLNFSLIDSLKSVTVLSLILSFFTMFLFLKTWFSKWPAFIGAFFYCWAPFRFNLFYLTGAIGTSVSFIFIPLIFLATILSFQSFYKKSIILGSICFALLMLSHQVTLLLFLPLWLTFTLFFLFSKRNLVAFIASITSLFFGLLLSSFFWIPAFIETKYLNFEAVLGLHKINYLPLDLLTKKTPTEPYMVDWLSQYSIGMPQIGIAIFSLFTIIFLLIIPTKKPKKTKIFIESLLLFTGFFVVGTFFITSYSSFFWDNLPLLKNFLYPQRFITLLVFISSILTTLFISLIKHQQKLIGLFVIFITIFLNYPEIRQTINRIDRPDIFYQSSNKLPDMWGEFLPKWANKQFYFVSDYERLSNTVNVVSGEATVSNLQLNTASILFKISSKTHVTIKLRQFYFPGWKIYANNINVPIEIGPNGEMIFKLQQGNFLIRVNFEKTHIRTASFFLTIASIIIFILFLIKFPYYFQKKIKKEEI